jgi:hypothetical protein
MRARLRSLQNLSGNIAYNTISLEKDSRSSLGTIIAKIIG